MKHAPALTGLRGVAVLLVVWFHAAFQSDVALPGGFLGVDVFFVLSAFLITALLVGEHRARGRLDLRAFYARRALRLLPALLAALVLAVVLRIVVGPVGSGLVEQVAAALLYVANWLGVAKPEQSGYLDHLWSLSVEEQFYLVWPAVLLLALRRTTPARLARWTALVALVAVVGRWWAHAAWPFEQPADFKLLYLNTFARVDELMIGATLGLLPVPVWRRLARFGLLGLVGLAVLVQVLLLRQDALYQWGFPAVAACVALVLAAAATETGAVARLLSWRGLTALGTVSYGLYLYHLPIVLAVAQQGWSDPVRVTAGLLLPVPVAVASWFWLEKPALRLKDRFEPARVMT